MEFKVDNSKTLISDELRDQVPEDFVDNMLTKGLYIVIDYEGSRKHEPISGLLLTILQSENPEFELRVKLEHALDIVPFYDQLYINKYAVFHGDNEVMTVAGKYVIKAARIQDIDVQDQLCTLAMQLEYSIKRV